MKTLSSKFAEFASHRKRPALATQVMREAFMAGAAAVAEELSVRDEVISREDVKRIAMEMLETLDRYADEINRFGDEMDDLTNRLN